MLAIVQTVVMDYLRDELVLRRRQYISASGMIRVPVMMIIFFISRPFPKNLTGKLMDHVPGIVNVFSDLSTFIESIKLL